MAILNIHYIYISYKYDGNTNDITCGSEVSDREGIYWGRVWDAPRGRDLAKAETKQATGMVRAAAGAAVFRILFKERIVTPLGGGGEN
jgi:hypothetical protein